MSPIMFWFGYLLGLGLGFWGGWIFGHPKGYTKGSVDERARWLPIMFPGLFEGGLHLSDEQIKAIYDGQIEVSKWAAGVGKSSRKNR